MVALVLAASGCGESGVDSASVDAPKVTQQPSDRAKVIQTEADADDVSPRGFDELPADLTPPGVVVGSSDPAAASRATMPTTVRELVQMRAEHDRTIWKDEVEVQRYERTFVSLWDRLIVESDKFAVLRSFPFGEVVLGSSIQTEPSDLGIRIHRFTGEPRSISNSQWASFLAPVQQQRIRDCGDRMASSKVRTWHRELARSIGRVDVDSRESCRFESAIHHQRQPADCLGERTS